MLKIALCVKQVPDTSDIKWTENNTMQRDGVESIINPYDIYATELAIRLKQNYHAEITAFTMGPQQASQMLKELIAIGTDKGVLISDKKFAGADTLATGRTIANAIKQVLPDFDIILCGQFAVDGDTAQTGPCIASILNIPQVTYTKDILKIEENRITATRLLDDGLETVEVQTPSLFAILKSDFEPTRPLINGVIKAHESEIKVITLADLNMTDDEVGIKGSPTYVSKAFRPTVKHFCEKHNCLENGDGARIIFDKINEVLND